MLQDSCCECTEFIVTRCPDIILADVEDSPYLTIKDAKHMAATREATSRSEAYTFNPLPAHCIAPLHLTLLLSQVHPRA